jgi:hypothetical protein
MSADFRLQKQICMWTCQQIWQNHAAHRNDKIHVEIGIFDIVQNHTSSLWKIHTPESYVMYLHSLLTPNLPRFQVS